MADPNEPTHADTVAADTVGAEPPSAASRPSQPPGFQLRQVIGQGGMGEVVLAEERLVGRDVAIKRMRGEPTPDAIARFLREARIQARLEHPSIVPVYQLGLDPDGLPYFAMKRLAGRTMQEILPTEREATLLRSFISVCQAIELAHSRGVVHRDLKPANVMLGDFGEVYVLDWGIARMLTDADEAVSPSTIAREDLATPTQTGALLGTPGYMAPEQARGQVADTAADIYALGAILFEILTRQALHPRGMAALSSTIDHPTVAPSTRRPEIAPELDSVCVDALAADPRTRPTAAALADRIQQFLDGDRDLERRRALAGDALATAHRAIATDDRAGAMQAAGRAMALDPTSDAASLVSKLMLEPPERIPAELDAHLSGVNVAFARGQWRKISLAWLSFLPVLPMLLWNGVANMAVVVTLCAVTASLGIVAEVWSRRGMPHELLYLCAGAAAAVIMSRFFGPFVLVPAALAIQIVGFMSYPAFLERSHRGAIPLAALVLAFVVALALESGGVLDSTWSIEGNAIVSRSTALLLGPRTELLLVSMHLVLLLVTGLFCWSLASARHTAQRRVEIQAWHLRKLLPET